MAYEARTSLWNLKWSIPNTPFTITGFSRAAYRTGFYIKELDTMLDAGPQNFNSPGNIFITHTHADHIACLPFTLIRDESNKDIVEIYTPKESVLLLRKYISSMFEVNSLEEDLNYKETQDNYFNITGLTGNNKFRTTLKKQLVEVEVVDCDHGVPTVSYCFSLIKNKLKDEYKELQGKEIAQLKKSGAIITNEVVQKTFAFICDTSIKVFENFPSILSYPIIFIECTFLYPEEEENAVVTKHIHWKQLKPYVVNNSNTLFVLIHFSLRYKDGEIEQFFDNERSNSVYDYNNIKLWIHDTHHSNNTNCGDIESSAINNNNQYCQLCQQQINKRNTSN